MKKVILILVAIFAISCTSEPKKTDVKEPKKDVPTQVKPDVTKQYPALTNVPSELNYIFDNGYAFTDDIKVDFIALEKKGDSQYQLIYGLGSETNLDRLEKLKVSAVFYAKDPSLFKDEIYKKRKSRQVPNVCKIFTLDGEHVIAQDFTIVPKEFNYVKFYFYNKDGVVNKKMLTVRKVNMPK